MLTELFLGLVLAAPLPKDREPDIFPTGTSFQWGNDYSEIIWYDPKKGVYWITNYNPAYHTYSFFSVNRKTVEEIINKNLTK
jgi:hypothetical protein